MAELLVGAGTGIVDQRRALRQQDRQDQLEARQLLEEEVAGRERERRGEELRRQRTVDVRVRIVWHGYGTLNFVPKVAHTTYSIVPLEPR